MFHVWYKSINADFNISNQQIEYLKDKYEFIECDSVRSDDKYLYCKSRINEGERAGYPETIAMIPHERVLIVLREKDKKE